MDAAFKTLQLGFVSPTALDHEGSWDAAVFLSEGYRSGVGHSQTLGDKGQIFEGVRGSLESNPSLYRGNSVRAFDLFPGKADWTQPRQASAQSIQPGDVVVKRVEPVAASVVPAELPSLQADNNIFVVRGLGEAEAWWLTYCLNHPSYANYLVSKSGRGVLGRISLAVLRGWSPPATPGEFPFLVQRLVVLQAKRACLRSQIASLEAEVEAAVYEIDAVTGYEDYEKCLAMGSWSSFYPASIVGDSWLPSHVASAYRSGLLKNDTDWRALPDFLLDEPPRHRLNDSVNAIPVLRLSDVTDLPLVPTDLRPSVPAQSNRIFREPVKPEDVLLSTLASSTRVAFAPSTPGPAVYAMDHWERLRFRSHAAAYALILETTAVAHQLRYLATGSVQQFVLPVDIQRIYLPVLPMETLSNWDRTFRSLSKAWQQTDSEWQSALREGWLVFCRTLNLTVNPSFVQ